MHRERGCGRFFERAESSRPHPVIGCGDRPKMSVWYLTPVLVQDLQILINIATALLATLFGPFAFGTNLVTLKLLVFNVLLPCACM